MDFRRDRQGSPDLPQDIPLGIPDLGGDQLHGQRIAGEGILPGMGTQEPAELFHCLTRHGHRQHAILLPEFRLSDQELHCRFPSLKEQGTPLSQTGTQHICQRFDVTGAQC